MSKNLFYSACIAIALIFTVIFLTVVVPALIQDGDVIGAFTAGFVNPYSSGYSADVILCWIMLAIWVAYDAHAHEIRHGWVCIVFGIVPGVAVGFPLYLVLRGRQLQERPE